MLGKHPIADESAPTGYRLLLWLIIAAWQQDPFS
jgi:hypothetical protein